jgi:hypothetical protein
VGLDISPEMGAEFAKFKLVGIEPHGNSKAHEAYNDAVGKELRDWSKANKVDLAKGTSTQARAFMTHIASSELPSIKSFNTGLINSSLKKGMSPSSRFMRNFGSGLAGAAAMGAFESQYEAHFAQQYLKDCAATGRCGGK